MGARSPLVDPCASQRGCTPMRKLVFGLILALGVSMFPAGAHADTVSDEAAFVAKINDLRASKGLSALPVNDNLVAKARGWAGGRAAGGRNSPPSPRVRITA